MAWHSSHKEIGHKQKMAGESAISTAVKGPRSEESPKLHRTEIENPTMSLKISWFRPKTIFPKTRKYLQERQPNKSVIESK